MLKNKKQKDWSILVLYIVFIYLSLPVAPEFWKWFTKTTGNFAVSAASILLGLIALILLYYLIQRRSGLVTFIWFFILISLYVFGVKNIKLPAEKIHFIEYGILSLFVFRALIHKIKYKVIYLYSGIIVFLIGLVDEGIQYLLPNRVYDTRDLLVNAASGILALSVISFCFQPKLELNNEKN